MRFEDISINVRPRNSWEAMDLGLSIVQQWWRDIIPAWLIITLPLFIFFNIIFRDSPGWALILTWWFKPLYDRVLLLVYSRRIFGQQLDIHQVLAELPHLLLHTGLWLHLTIYRLDFTRSFRLPVWQLEGLGWKSRSKRMYALSRRSGGYATWLTLICLHLEAFVQLSIIGLVWMFTPEVIVESVWEYFWNLIAGDTFPYWFLLSANVIYLLGVSIIEPFFVAAGFALYLNRRTLLEGWDIEMAFRQIANRLGSTTRPAGNGRIAASLVSTCLLACLLLPNPVNALEDNSDDAVKEPLATQRLATTESARVIQEVLADKDFGGERATEEWVLRDIESSDIDGPDLELDWLGDLVRATANVAEVLLWAGVILLALFLLVRLARLINPPTRKQPPRAVPAVISGLDIRPESLPDDVVGEARRLWQKGRYRDAMSLIYRGTVSSLVHAYSIELTEGATEGDVQQASRAVLGQEGSNLLHQITVLWQSIAYAHRRPAADQGDAVFEQWEKYFGRMVTPVERAPRS